MAFCSKCGAPLEEGAKFCSACGQTTEAAPAAEATQAQYQQPQYQAPAAEDTFPKEEVEAGKIVAILGYIIPILFFLPLVSGEKTAYGTFHANQALILFIAWIISSILTIAIIGLVLYIACFVFMILGIVSACNGSKKPLPGIGAIKIIK